MRHGNRRPAVPANQLTLTPLAFVSARRIWPSLVASSDPEVPFQGQVVLDLSPAADMGRAYRDVEATLADSSLAPRPVYRMSWAAPGRFRLVALALEITWPAAVGLGTQASLPLTGNRWWTGTAWGRPQPGLIDLVEVAGGSFLMGSPAGVGDGDERPQRRVTLTGFRMGRTEVTQEEYLAAMGANPSWFKERAESPGRPVESVSWLDAVAFCNALSILEGLTPAYRVIRGGGWDFDAVVLRSAFRPRPKRAKFSMAPTKNHGVLEGAFRKSFSWQDLPHQEHENFLYLF